MSGGMKHEKQITTWKMEGFGTNPNEQETVPPSREADRYGREGEAVEGMKWHKEDRSRWVSGYR
jgi:hypothetical protein